LAKKPPKNQTNRDKTLAREPVQPFPADNDHLTILLSRSSYPDAKPLVGQHAKRLLRLHRGIVLAHIMRFPLWNARKKAKTN
jgi:hypothetical protein